MENRLPSLLKPNLRTKFHIDFDWWRSQDRNWRNALVAFMCPEHQAKFADSDSSAEFDLVDPKTAAVTRGDAILDVLTHHCAHQEGFLSGSAPLVDTIFKYFLVNENQPLSAEELGEKLQRQPAMILATIGSSRVYKGIRPL